MSPSAAVCELGGLKSLLTHRSMILTCKMGYFLTHEVALSTKVYKGYCLSTTVTTGLEHRRAPGGRVQPWADPPRQKHEQFEVHRDEYAGQRIVEGRF